MGKTESVGTIWAQFLWLNADSSDLH